MRDLVRDHERGRFVVTTQLEQPPRDVDVSAGQGRHRSILRAWRISRSILSRLFAGLATVPPRRKLELAFERAIERGFGFVADIERHLQRTLIGGLEQPRSKLQTPLRLIVEGLAYVKSGT
jgi:hypothetical protein